MYVFIMDSPALYHFKGSGIGVMFWRFDQSGFKHLFVVVVVLVVSPVHWQTECPLQVPVVLCNLPDLL